MTPEQRMAAIKECLRAKFLSDLERGVMMEWLAFEEEGRGEEFMDAARVMYVQVIYSALAKAWAEGLGRYGDKEAS